MLKQDKFLFYHRRKIEFAMDEEEEGQIDCYKVDVNFWVIYDPEVNYKVIDDFYINSIEKNGEELEFILQKDIPEELKTEILNQLEYEV